MRVSATMYSVNKLARAGQMNVEQFIRYCGTIGLDGVDLLSYYWTDMEAELPRVASWLQQNHLALAAYAVSNDFVQADAQQRQAHIQTVLDGIAVAARLGAPVMRVFGGRRPKPDSPISTDAALHMVTEALADCERAARAAGVVLAVENHGGLPGTAREVHGVLTAVNSPWVRATLDTGNFVHMGDDLIAATKLIAPLAAHVHIKDLRASSAAADAGRQENVAAGSGELPLRASIEVLRDSGYAGFLSMEYEGTGDALDALKTGGAFLRSVVTSLHA